VLLPYFSIMKIRSVSFDTSFLLKNNFLVDTIFKKIEYDRLPCFVTTTVVSELEQLKVFGRITETDYKKAGKRLKHVHATVIDFKNRLLSDAFGKACMISMEKHHGVKPEDIVNDCNILVSTLKNGVDVFLSEDFHFTSKITKEVVDELSNAACREFHMMCDTHLYSVNAETFLAAYIDGDLNLDVVSSRLKDIRKNGKLLRSNEKYTD
jgi:rRNA-processing protein FCF1